MRLDLIQTVAFAGLVLFVGYALKRLIPPLSRGNIPAPVAGGLPVAALLTLSFTQGWPSLTFDTALQVPLQNAFFASVGFAASFRLLRRGGLPFIVFLVVAVIVAALQNVVGATTATLLGQDALMGVLAGSPTLTGGPATGLAFAKDFEAAGVLGAPTLAVAAAMVGIVSGGLLGGPIATWLLARRGISETRNGPPGARRTTSPASALNVAEAQFSEPPLSAPSGEDVEAFGLLKHVALMATAIGLGTWTSAWITETMANVPVYIGGMLVAALFRNIDDATGIVGMSQRTIDDLGSVALALFLVMALMTLRLWELAGLVTPLLVILAVQVAMVTVICVVVIPGLMGNDYEAVVMSSGFCGFMLGTTANAMANMDVLVARYGPAPKAYLVVPLVGTIFIDFFNVILITFALNILR